MRYIGHFEIPDLDEFLRLDRPEEMKEAIEQASRVTTNRKILAKFPKSSFFSFMSFSI